MIHLHLRVLCACLLALPVAVCAQSAVLAPQAERIDDTTIQRDYQAYEQTQARIKALNDGGRRVANYHLAKAQCWLDVSFHEYTRNDRSAFPQGALTESEKLIAMMEARNEPLPNDTPLVNGAARLRPDLWERFQRLREDPGFICVAQKVACAEVELVHAGNEFNQQGWRHAKPYVQIAEDLIAESQTAAATCNPPPQRAAVAPPAVAVPEPSPVADAPRVMRVNVVFRFDRSGRSDILPAGLAELDRLVTSLRGDRFATVSVKLVGHADRLNSTGERSYNQRLSQRRAETVRSLLVEKGIDARSIDAGAAGDREPVAGCRGGAQTVELEDCLLPNRRVELTFTVAAKPFQR